MFEKLPERARKLNATLIQMWEEGAEEALGEASEIREVTYNATSDSAEGIYLFPQELRGLRKRGKDGGLIVDPAQVYEADIPNEDRYRIIDVKLNDYKHDKIGQYGVIAYQHGVSAATGPVIDLEELIEGADAATALCFDDTPFFGTAHPVDPAKKSSGTWSNKLVRPAGLTFDTFGEAFELMLAFPSSTPNKAAGSKPSHLLVSADYYGMAKDICENEFPSMLQGGRNKWLGENLKPIVVPNWKTRSLWMLADARSKRKRPWVFQERESLQLVPHGIDPNGAMEYERGSLRWITKGMHGVGFGYPTKALLSTKS